MKTDRALAAATAIVRDFAHMIPGPTFEIPLAEHLARNLINPARNLMVFASEGTTRTFLLSELPYGYVQALMDTKNKRRRAVVTLAMETGSRVTVDLAPEDGARTTARLTVHTSLSDMRGHSDAAMAATATYLGVTHSEMMRIIHEKMGRGDAAAGFDVDDESREDIGTLSIALYRITRWADDLVQQAETARIIAKAARARAASPLSDVMPAIRRLHELLEAITPEGLAHADMPLFDEAVGIARQLAA